MAEQSRAYGNFRGVDFTSDPAQVSPYRFSHCVNMWKDYESQNGIAVETFPGFRRLAIGAGTVNGIHKFNGKIYCHIGTKLHLLDGQFTEKANGIADHKSTSFVWGDKLYILDGTDYWVYDGTLKKVSEDAYIPTVKTNGAEYEQGNILSDKQVEKFILSDFEETHSPYIEFNTASFQSGTVQAFSFVGFGNKDVNRVVKIPAKVDKNVVEGISWTPGDTQNLVDLIIPSTVKHIEGNFSGLPINRIWFGGTAEEWSRIKSTYGDAIATMGTAPIFFGKEPDSGVLYYDGDLKDTAVANISDKFNATFVYVDSNTSYTPKGSYVLVLNNLDKVKMYSAKKEIEVEKDADFPKCTLVQSFNGNLFFSGSPDAPNKIWWCAAPAYTGIPSPNYIGEYNYDLCGLDDSPIVSMMAQSSVLTVFKQKSDQDATIYYYTPIESESDLVPSIYAESEGGSGIACVGASCNFLDDAVFLSKRGLEGIQKTAVNLERSVVHRSSFVDAKLQAEDLSSAFLLEWKGYLCILFPNGHMYLADSRRTAGGNEGTEYEWFYVEGLQGYGNDFTNEYMYADVSDLYYLGVADIGGNTLNVKEDASVDDIVPRDEVKSVNINGKDVHYESDTYYLCKKSEELSHDTIRQDVSCATVIDDVLYFGAGGSLYCINTDKRVNGEIPTKWYTFCGRRYQSGFVTFADNCGAPHLRKKTIKKSVVVKTKSMPHSKFFFKIGTDRVPFGEEAEVHTSGELDFSDLGFDATNFFTQKKSVIPFRSSAKKFVEVQFMFYSDGFRRPFGIYNMAFRYEVTGRVKE